MANNPSHFLTLPHGPPKLSEGREWPSRYPDARDCRSALVLRQWHSAHAGGVRLLVGVVARPH
jgi:hypothetical protein